MKTIEDLRSKFPALNQKVYGKTLVYLDNAATAQKPQELIDLVNTMNSATNANVHRGLYDLSDRVTALYEGARDKVRDFINAPQRENIIFTSGTTASINLVASSFGQMSLRPGDSVIVTQDSHHSNIVPWQLACKRAGAELKVLPIDDNGQWILDELYNLIDTKVKMIAVPHISNVLGLVNPIKKVIDIAHKFNIPVLVDGAQGIVHAKVDVVELDCDFYAFSGHKIYAEPGIGILYGKKELLEQMPPFMGGGDMVGTVTFTNTSYAALPLKFEAGTPNFIGAASLTPALDLALELRRGSLADELAKSEKAIISYMLDALSQIKSLKIYGLGENKIPLFSFTIDGAHPQDLAMILDKMGFAFRTGMLCAEPLMQRFGVNSMLRVSFAAYNTLEEAEAFISALKKAVKMFE